MNNVRYLATIQLPPSHALFLWIKMVSVIAKTIRSRRQDKGVELRLTSIIQTCKQCLMTGCYTGEMVIPTSLLAPSAFRYVCVFTH